MAKKDKDSPHYRIYRDEETGFMTGPMIRGSQLVYATCSTRRWKLIDELTPIETMLELEVAGNGS